jgi:hypothetical protein
VANCLVHRSGIANEDEVVEGEDNSQEDKILEDF